VVINADSMQVYRELSILTARPTVQEEARAPHALYGFVDGAEGYSAGRYAVDASRAIAAARSSARVPIVVGGTGLYLKALLEGLSPVPAIGPDVRAHWRGQAVHTPSAELHAILARRDPATAAQLMPTDPQRIVRALEVLDGTGRPLAEWQRTPGEPVLVARETLRLLVLPDRDTHAATIDARFDAMLAAGALEEVRGLVAMGLSAELPIMRALGVAPLAAAIAGKLALNEAAARAKAETRQFSKRQGTWFKRNMITWQSLSAQESQNSDAIDLSFIGL
jgi:tRNA dimethylallyltransferase